jgi:ribosomal protein S18 acetylase RimI-like enzyme
LTQLKQCLTRRAVPGDKRAAYQVCLETGDLGGNAEALYRDDPDALARIFVGPYLAFEPDFCLVLEDADGVCGYALGALDSRVFYERYEREWRPALCAQFPDPTGDPASWTHAQRAHHTYHHPDSFCPEPYEAWPSHLHIDLLPRAQGRGYGRRLLEQLMDALHRRGSPGVHLGLSALNMRAFGFYIRLGFRELCRAGSGQDACIYMGMPLPYRTFHQLALL